MAVAMVAMPALVRVFLCSHLHPHHHHYYRRSSSNHGSLHPPSCQPPPLHLPDRDSTVVPQQVCFMGGGRRESQQQLLLHFPLSPFPLSQGIRKRLPVFVNANFNSGGGGSGKNDSSTMRVLGNLALAVGLTYLSLNGQLGWVLDAIVSVWLLAVLLPIIGLGAFLWLAGRDIIQDACPNCGNTFQIFKSAMKDGVQLCPFCTQPFSVQGRKFVRESANYSRNPFDSSSSSGFSARSQKGRTSPANTIVDIEAEVKDAD